jgi:glycerol uptake facilitator-like aquaporin
MLAQQEKPLNELKTKKFWSSVIAEYLGTGLLVYVATSVCSVRCDTNQTRDNKTSNNVECSLAYGLGAATLAHWTDGLLNPALTVAFTSTGKMTLTKGVAVIIVEIVGGNYSSIFYYCFEYFRLRDFDSFCILLNISFSQY